LAFTINQEKASVQNLIFHKLNTELVTLQNVKEQRYSQQEKDTAANLSIELTAL